MIDIRHLQKYYRSPDGKHSVKVLSDVNLWVKQGEFVAVMGESGAGKSTLMNIIGLLDEKDGGEYFLAGEDISLLSHKQKSLYRSKCIGFVFQNSSLLPSLTALENVMLPLSYQHIGKKERVQKAKAALDAVGLSDRLSHLPSQLSGGQRQKVAIARAIAVNPRVILADEPTGALDAKSGKEVMQLLTKMAQSGKTVVLITHDPNAAAYANRIVRLEKGRLCQQRMS